MNTIGRVVRAAGQMLSALLALSLLGALVVGVPWGLWHYIGWPLPTQIPTGADLEAFLLSPLSTSTLLALLACLAWPLWLVFVVDVARCVPDALRGIRVPAVGPVHALASFLVAAAVLGLLNPRSQSALAAPIAVTMNGPASVLVRYDLTTPVQLRQPAPIVAVPAVGGPRTTTYIPAHHAPVAEAGTVLVRAPHHGIYDSLWRIAERELGDGARWPAIFERNHGVPQADGTALTQPDLIRPGWILYLPDQPATTPPPNVDQSRSVPPPAQTPTPTPTSEPTPVPSTDPAAGADSPRRTPARTVSSTPGVGIALATGGFLALSVASGVTLALARRRRRRRRSYVPGSGHREPPESMTPVVRTLRLAYDQHQLDLEPDVEPDGDDPDEPPPGGVDPGRDIAVDDGSRPQSGSVELGIRDGRAQAVNVAGLHGLGITGAGTEATARALLVDLLTTTAGTVLIPEQDATRLLGADLPASPRLRTMRDLDAATTALARHLTAHLNGECQSEAPTVVLVASVTGPQPRLQQILDNATHYGVQGILLGHWPAGATVRVDATGLITATSPNLAELHGTRLFHLGASDTRDLIELLTDIPPNDPSTAQPQPSTPDPALPDDDDADTDVECLTIIPEQPRPPDHPPPPVPISHPDPTAHNEPSSPVAVAMTAAAEPSSGALAAEQGPITEPATATPESAPGTSVSVLTADPQAPLPLSLSLLGPVALHWHTPEGPRELSTVLSPKHTALLTLLGLHPDGISREALREELWPNANPRRPFNALYATTSQIRKALQEATQGQVTDPFDQRGERFSLNRQTITVDYWDLLDADHARRVATNEESRLEACWLIASLYRGELAEHQSQLGLEAPREAAHRAALDALAELAAHYRNSDPNRQLQLLEHARLLAPDNEAIYRDIMRTQAALGLTDAINRTMQLLTSTFAAMGDRPDPNTVTLARALQARHQTSPA